MRESQIEKILKQKVERSKGKCYKWVSPGCRGVPDRIVVWPGGRPAVFVELKAPSGVLSRIQEARILDLRIRGQRVYIIDSVDSLSQFFQDEGFEETSKEIDCEYEL